MGFLATLSATLFGQPTYGPVDSVAQPGSWLLRAIQGGRTKSSVPVNEFTALSLPAVYACINRIANPIASFPISIFRTNDAGGAVQLGPDDHPLARRLGLRPNEFMSSRTLRKTIQAHALLWGNGYAEIERNAQGQAINLWPLLPDRTGARWENGRFSYRSNIAGSSVDLDQGDVIHVMDLSHDGYVGISPIAKAREAIGLGLAMEEFGSKFFANDAKSGGFLMHPGKLSAGAQANLGAARRPAGGGDPRVTETVGNAVRTDPGAGLERQGGLDNAHRIKVLEEGMKFVSTTIPPEDAQFLASREFQIADVARIYDVPLVLLQSHEKTTSWGSGIEQLMIGFVRSTLEPWVRAWEQELNWKLFTEAERALGYYVKFNMNALLRGDMAARAAFYQALFSMAGLSPNQILSLEDMDPIGPDGDERFVSTNLVALKTALNPPASPGEIVNVRETV